MEKSTLPDGLFVRQASGLVRDVSMTQALFFNIAAFVGTAVGWAIAFYALYPEWQELGISAYAWMALLTGVACYFLGIIFASLTTAIPRSGGDYVFTSRIIGPLWGWIESWPLVGSALTIIGFEIIVATHNIQLTAILLGTAFPGSSFGGAVNWFQDDVSKIITGIIIMLIIADVAAPHTHLPPGCQRSDRLCHCLCGHQLCGRLCYRSRSSERNALCPWYQRAEHFEQCG